MRLVSQRTQKIIHLANMRQSQRQTTDFILKAEKQKGVAYRELLANLYQNLLEKCLTAGAADMNRPNYCPVNSILIFNQPVGCYNQHFLISILPPFLYPPNQHDQSAVSNQRFTLTKSADQRFTPAPNFCLDYDSFLSI